MRMPIVGTDAAASLQAILPETFVWLWLGLVVLATHGHEMSAWSAVALFSRRSFHLFTTDDDEEHDNDDSSSRRQRRRSSHRHLSSQVKQQQQASKLWRIPGEQGLAILILTSLWTLVRPIGYQSYAWIIPWILASRDSILSRILSISSSPSSKTASTSAISSYLVALLGLMGLWCHTAWRWYAPGKMLVAHFLGDNIIQHVGALQQVFSADEWQTFSFLAASVWLQWMEEIVTKRQEGFFYFFNLHDNPDQYSTLVVCAGSIGIVWAASWVASRRQNKWSLGVRLLILVILPLALVEVSLYLVTIMEEQPSADRGSLPWIPQEAVPRCTRWLLHFLLQSNEQPLWDTITPMHLPRFVWLIYWALVASIGIVVAPSGPSRVVTRKWFHAVAVLLFTPVTVYAPLFMSIGYAIAVAVLVALEAVRPSWPLLQHFYTRYLDPTKDGGGAGREIKGNDGKANDVVIISHTALIMGCAMPLWCYQMAGDRLSPFVPFVGIVVVGVGDACGAVVGKYFGRNRWSSWLPNLPKNNHRTIEGSVAMFMSQALFIGILGSWGIPVQWWAVCLPLVFATLLEAWTTQMDNLMLPLAVTAFYSHWEEALVANTWTSS